MYFSAVYIFIYIITVYINIYIYPGCFQYLFIFILTHPVSGK